MLSADQLRQKAEKAVEDTKRHCYDLSEWKSVSVKDDIEIFTRPGAKDTEDMFLLIAILPCSMEKVEKLVSPWLGYRLTWDQMLENAEILEKWSDEEIYLIRHIVKKLYTISARDSIDIVKVQRNEGEVIMASTSVQLDNHPPTKDYVRTTQHLGGYILCPNKGNPDETKFHMLFHADLNLPGPRFVSSLANKFKPKLMRDKIDNLKAAIEKIDI